MQYYVLIDDLVNHPVLKQLEQITDLKHTCGYVTMLCTGAPITNKKGSGFKNITGRPIDGEWQVIIIIIIVI